MCRFHAGMDDPLDDFVFEPAAWDLAAVIRLQPDPDTDRPALDDLADAMLVWAEGPEVERLTDEAVARIWSEELAREIREGLERLSTTGDEWAPAASVALGELEASKECAPITRAVVQHIAMKLGHLDAHSFFCLCCIDEAVANAHQGARREVALQAAVVARRNVGAGRNEIQEALAGWSPVEHLATDARRKAVRQRLGRLGHLGRESISRLANELRVVGNEPLPMRPQDDDVWCAVCTALLADVARPELN